MPEAVGGQPQSVVPIAPHPAVTASVGARVHSSKCEGEQEAEDPNDQRLAPNRRVGLDAWKVNYRGANAQEDKRDAPTWKRRG